MYIVRFQINLYLDHPFLSFNICLGQSPIDYYIKTKN